MNFTEKNWNECLESIPTETNMKLKWDAIIPTCRTTQPKVSAALVTVQATSIR